MKKTVSLSVFFDGAIISYATKAHKTVSLSVFLEGAIIIVSRKLPGAAQ